MWKVGEEEREGRGGEAREGRCRLAHLSCLLPGPEAGTKSTFSSRRLLYSFRRGCSPEASGQDQGRSMACGP